MQGRRVLSLLHSVRLPNADFPLAPSIMLILPRLEARNSEQLVKLEFAGAMQGRRVLAVFNQVRLIPPSLPLSHFDSFPPLIRLIPLPLSVIPLIPPCLCLSYD